MNRGKCIAQLTIGPDLLSEEINTKMGNKINGVTFLYERLGEK